MIRFSIDPLVLFSFCQHRTITLISLNVSGLKVESQTKPQEWREPKEYRKVKLQLNSIIGIVNSISTPNSLNLLSLKIRLLC